MPKLVQYLFSWMETSHGVFAAVCGVTAFGLTCRTRTYGVRWDQRMRTADRRSSKDPDVMEPGSHRSSGILGVLMDGEEAD